MTAMVLLSSWMASQVEFWKPIEGYEGYYDVSSHGRIRSWRHPCRRGHVLRPDIPPRVLKESLSNRGYRRVILEDMNGARRTLFVHQLSAKAFIPNPEGRTQINHLTGLKRDCRIDGLEWTTPAENSRHAVRHGLSGAKSEEQVREIRRMAKSGIPQAVIARQLNLSSGGVCLIIQRRRYAHVAD
jgi:NUMOD4 motif